MRVSGIRGSRNAVAGNARRPWAGPVAWRRCSGTMDLASQVGRAVPGAPGAAGEGPPALPAGGSWRVPCSLRHCPWAMNRASRSADGLVRGAKARWCGRDRGRGRPRSGSCEGWLSAVWPGGLVGVLALLQVHLQAGVFVQVDYTGAVGERRLVDSGGVAVPEGNEVRLGTFSEGPAVVAANAGDLRWLQTHWLPFGATQVRTLFGDPEYAGSFADTATGADSSLDDQRIYLWAFKTSNKLPPSGGSDGFGNVEEYGLFSSTDTGWTFPVLGLLPPDNLRLINTGEVDIAFAGRIVAGTSGALQLQLVPEATTSAVLAALGLLGFAIARAARQCERRKGV